MAARVAKPCSDNIVSITQDTMEADATMTDAVVTDVDSVIVDDDMDFDSGYSSSSRYDIPPDLANMRLGGKANHLLMNTQHPPDRLSGL